MDISTLLASYASGQQTPEAVVAAAYDTIERDGLRPVWISLVPREQALRRARELQGQESSKLPLYGIPFAVKDNIDVAGMPTTAACTAFAYTPEHSATAVARLEAAGAILIGKTNMDQFATGLVGTRSPFGACSSVFGAEFISGGSSSGSSVAVAKGLVSFSLGTDTAGSGRVPAMFNNLVGLKPTRGTVSAAGVVPACRTLDCVSIFAETAGDAARVYSVVHGPDIKDDFSRVAKPGQGAAPWSPTAHGDGSVRIGFLARDQRQFFGDSLNDAMYQQAVDAAEKLGATLQAIDLTPFLQTAQLLYGGPWVAERYAALGAFYDSHASEMDSTVASILGSAKAYTAAQAFEGQYRLAQLQQQTQRVWAQVDVLLLPTAPRTFTHSEIAEAPVERNSILGTYTNFVNLLDLAAVALPAGMRGDGLPFGVSLIGPAFSDEALLLLADALQRRLGKLLGGSQRGIESAPAIARPEVPHGCQLMTVVGAHLTGQPLNRQLTSRGGRLVRTCRTHPDYRLYALKDTVPPKPGLVWSPGFVGPGIEVEVWALPVDTAGSFIDGIPQPLGIGNVRLEDGTLAKGFIVEAAGLEGATEITQFGGWRAYLRSFR